MEHFFRAVKEMAKQNPLGFTVDLTTLKKVTAGISVAYFETQDCFGEDGLKKVLEHALENEKKVGGWFNDGNSQFYFDSVRIFTDLEEAKRFGRENRQIAIFDLGNLRLIKL
jgi:fructokinase